MRKFLAASIVVFMLLAMVPVYATLGPIHVELNMVKPRISAARANTLIAFKIYIRFNINIQNCDLIKMWFPIDEKGLTGNPNEIADKICNGFTKIDENIKDRRFIPNEEYFKKYDNPYLKTVGKIYEISGKRGSTKFIPLPDESNKASWGDICSGDDVHPRIIKDPSGLGYWMLGTVFPSMPFDEKQRKELLQTIDRSTSIGYSPCGECCGVLEIVNSCNERSLALYSPLTIEGWRKGYNSIDINTSKNTGIIAPATSGRYRIAVATTPEPTPVESEAFVLPCSDISDVTCELGSNNSLAVNFKVGEGGALDGGSSTIMLNIPKTFVLPKRFKSKSIKLNGVPVTTTPQIMPRDNGTEITIVASCDINNMGFGKLEFSADSGMTYKISRENQIISVSTSSEPNPIQSKPFKMYNQTTTLLPDFELTMSSVKLETIIPEGKSYPADTQIAVTFPEGFVVPKTIDKKLINVNDKILAKDCQVNGQTLTFPTPVGIDAGLKIIFDNITGITNPKHGQYKISVKIGDSDLDCGTVNIQKSVPRVFNLDLSDFQGSKPSVYDFYYETSVTRPLDVGEMIAIEFPAGTVIPKNPDTTKITIDGKPVISVGVDKTILKIGIPEKIVFQKPVRIYIDCRIENTRHHGEYVLKVSAVPDEPVNSEEFAIEPAPLKSWIYFKDPDKPNCGEWFNKPPILGFDCLNLDAKITFWFNDQPDKAMNYGGESRMMPGSQRAKITWYAQFGSNEENEQTYSFYLDTVPPPITVTEPRSAKITTNKSSIRIEGERGYTEMLTDGDNEKYQVTDSVFVRFNGQETQLLTGEIYETINSGDIQYKFSHTISLNEGTNEIEIIARDQACNENIVKRIVTLDTTAPKFEIISPKPEETFVEGDDVDVKVKTEESATVYIDGKLANMDKVENGFGYFSGQVWMVNGRNLVDIKVVDVAGNTSSQILIIKANPKKTVIVLTLDKKEWTVNGTDQIPLKTAPTATFKQANLKALNGNTYMPITQVAPLLDCAVAWDAKDKKVTLTQALADGKTKTLELWLNKTIGKIDGREVTYNTKGTIFPTVIAGNTCLPFRWFAENLGADVQYDSKTKQITLIYPK